MLSEWQPMETAPKDETPVLGFVPPRPFDHCGPIRVIQFDPKDGKWWHMAGDETDTVQPTHWIPLPPPPQD